VNTVADAGADARAGALAATITCAGKTGTNIITGEGASTSTGTIQSPPVTKRRPAGRKQGPLVRVLVVDDISTNRLLLKRILKNIARRIDIPTPLIVTAEDGREAVDLVAATFAAGSGACSPFHLILLDRQMPKMDGVEAAKLIKELQTGHFGVGGAQSAHVVGMSASIDTGEWLEAGVDELMGKPCPVNALETLIRFIVTTRIPPDRINV
jgi:CheY-like chemotaxis protein